MAAKAVSKEDTNPSYYVLAPLLCEEENGAAVARERYPQWMVNGLVPDSNCRDSYFLYACYRCDVRVAQVLLALGANVAAKSKYGCSALAYACGGFPLRSAGKPKTQIVAWLLEHTDVCTHINNVNESGSVALHSAAANGNALAVRMLLCFGADRTTRNKRGETAAALARICGREEVVQLIENWKEPEEWRPWTHAGLPYSYRDATRTLAVLARSVYP